MHILINLKQNLIFQTNIEILHLHYYNTTTKYLKIIDFT